MNILEWRGFIEYTNWEVKKCQLVLEIENRLKPWASTTSEFRIINEETVNDYANSYMFTSEKIR
jgi:hypothetical protein